MVRKDRMLGGITHGDFWLGNVLFTDGAVSGVINWEWAERDRCIG